MWIDKILVDKMSVDKMSVDKMSVDRMTWCRDFNVFSLPMHLVKIT
jgi:hypothetical protein